MARSVKTLKTDTLKINHPVQVTWQESHATKCL